MANYVTNENAATLMTAISEKISNSIIQKLALPTPSFALLNKIYQYVGATTNDYTNGYFYKCVENLEDLGTYIWEQVDVQPSGNDMGLSIVEGKLNITFETT